MKEGLCKTPSTLLVLILMACLLCREIREATTSMTSVPKPLKFLRPHYQTLKEAYSLVKDAGNKRRLADVISVLAITTGKEGERESLKFRLQGSKVCNSRVVVLT